MRSDALVARLVGGVLLATGVLVILLGGLCTGWLVLPDVVRALKFEGFFRTLVELWLPLAGGMMTIVIGVLIARAGLRRIRGAGTGHSSDDQYR